MAEGLDGFWEDRRTLEVLARRDIGQLFRMVQRITGATQTRLGATVGLSQAQVSEIVSGTRKVTSVDVIARVVTGLAIPDPARTVLFLGDQANSDLPAGNDVVTAYPERGLIARPQWNDAIRGAQQDLWLYGMAELGYALDDEVPAVIERAAMKGCDIRILLLDPDYPGINEIDSDEGSPPGTLRARICAALQRFAGMNPQAKIRTYSAMPTVSIVRRDDQMIMTHYLRYLTGGNSPSWELKRQSGKTFDRYVKHFQGAWRDAKEWPTDEYARRRASHNNGPARQT